MGGVAANAEFVILGGRNAKNTHDVFRCFDATDGTPLWSHTYQAEGELDYGNSPRATPLFYKDMVILLGAFGDLSCLDIETGLPLWQINIRKKFNATNDLKWGTCASPLFVDNKLIINPGANDASIVALDPETGKVLWKTKGEAHAYASFIVAKLGGVRQLVGYDKKSLGGWDVATGKRLWKVVPKRRGDFNVPTPQVIRGKLFTATENNGARLFAFDKQGIINPKPAAVYEDLAPDMSSPVVVGERLYCVNNDLYCLDASNGHLKELWLGEDEALGEYAAIIASRTHLLIIGRGGELLLVDATADSFKIVSRLKPFSQGSEESNNAQHYAHPALVGTKLYIRNEHEIVCLELAK